jgi:hypothetical protein
MIMAKIDCGKFEAAFEAATSDSQGEMDGEGELRTFLKNQGIAYTDGDISAFMQEVEALNEHPSYNKPPEELDSFSFDTLKDFAIEKGWVEDSD